MKDVSMAAAQQFAKSVFGSADVGGGGCPYWTIRYTGTFSAVDLMRVCQFFDTMNVSTEAYNGAEGCPTCGPDPAEIELSIKQGDRFDPAMAAWLAKMGVSNPVPDGA